MKGREDLLWMSVSFVGFIRYDFRKFLVSQNFFETALSYMVLIRATSGWGT